MVAEFAAVAKAVGFPALYPITPGVQQTEASPPAVQQEGGQLRPVPPALPVPVPPVDPALQQGGTFRPSQSTAAVQPISPALQQGGGQLRPGPAYSQLDEAQLRELQMQQLERMQQQLDKMQEQQQQLRQQLQDVAICVRLG